MDLILASASPRRAALLAQVGWSFQVMPVDIAEDLRPDMSIKEAVMDLALRKARACRTMQGLIVAADTVVVLEGKVLGKPDTPQAARDMLRALSGRKHKVITGVALVNPISNESLVEAEQTAVLFKELSDAEIQAYVASGEPMDKAGAYGIQGKGALLVESLQGCYYNVVGLPLVRLDRMLDKFGYRGA